MPIPSFRSDGFLPDGIHLATVTEIRERFGSMTARRRELMQRVDLWLELARMVGAKRLVLGGSFVSRKHSPNDVDAVIFVASDFDDRIREFDSAVWELRDCVYYREPAELFLVKTDELWEEWMSHFSQVRDDREINRGVVEIQL
jgi:hypothetical protein